MKTSFHFLLIAFILQNLNAFSQDPVLLKDIHPTFGSSPANYVEFNGNTYFTANDGATGNELWITDGTELGTQLLKDINTGVNSSNPTSLKGAASTLYFFANDGIAGNEIWSSDGTTLGTNGLSNLNPGGSGQPLSTTLTEYEGKVYFQGQGPSSSGKELYAADQIGATLFDLFPGSGSSEPANMITFNNNLFFVANGLTGSIGREWWSTDGITASIVKDLNPDPFQGSILFGVPSSIVFNGLLFFPAQASTSQGVELCVSDGTAAGTQLFADLLPGTGGSSPDAFFEFNNHLFFTAIVPGGQRKLWISDGTPGGTQLFGDITMTSGQQSYIVVNNKMYFYKLVSSPPIIREVWVTDGTVNGTQLFLSSTTSPAFNNIALFTSFDNKLYFGAAPVGGSGFLLYRTENDLATLEEVKPANSTSTSTNPQNLTVCGDKLYFSATYDVTIGQETYSIDGLNPVIWTGNTSTNWFDITNWEPQQIPGELDNIKIPAGRPNYPIVTNGQEVSSKQLIMESGSSFTMTAGNAYIYGKITAPDASVFNLLGGIVNLYHGSILPPNMTFKHLTIKNINNIAGKNYYEIPGVVDILGSLTVLSTTPAQNLPFIHLKEGDQITVRNNLILKEGVIGLDFQEPLPNDRSLTPTIRLFGTAAQTINIPAGLNGNLFINNSNAKFTNTTTPPLIKNLILNKSFDLDGQNIVLTGKLIYTDGFNNFIQITNSKPNKGTIVIASCEEDAYDMLPQYIKITKLKGLKYNGGLCNLSNDTIVLVNPMTVEELRVTGLLDLLGNTLTIGATTHSRGKLIVDSLVTEVASGTLKLLGNANTPQYSLLAKDLNNLVLNSPAGVILKNAVDFPTTSDSWYKLKLYGNARLESGSIDLNGTEVRLVKDENISASNLGKIVESPGNVFTTSGNNGLLGTIEIDSTISQPVSLLNLGGLGFIITCPNPLSNIWIRRSNVSFPNANGFTSIARLFEITNQQSNPILDARIKLKYDESELNGVNESDLKIFRISYEDSGPLSTWTEIVSSVNTTTNTITSNNTLFQLDISNTLTYYTLGAFPPPFQVPHQSKKLAHSVNSEMLVYPNPFHSTMTTDILSEINENAILKITDVSGKLVHTQSLKLAEGLNNIKVDVGSNLPAGIYILHVTSLHTNKVVKIVKE